MGSTAVAAEAAAVGGVPGVAVMVRAKEAGRGGEGRRTHRVGVLADKLAVCTRHAWSSTAPSLAVGETVI